MTTNAYMIQTRTGKIHMSAQTGTRACRPNSSGLMHWRVTEEQARAAAYSKVADNFCAKCFPDGRPSDAEIAKLFPAA